VEWIRTDSDLYKWQPLEEETMIFQFHK